MKKIITLLCFVLASLASSGQCSTVSVQISSSDTTLIKFYHAGFFNIPSGFDNICEWTVTSFSGTVLFQDTTSGGFNEQSNTIFNHSVPITDSMKVSLLITNYTEGITCSINDTLYWKETEVLPGAFIGNWEVLSSNGGVEGDITTSLENTLALQAIKLYPSVVYDYFQVEGEQELKTFTILDLSGRMLQTYQHIGGQTKADMSHYSPGMYFVRFLDKHNRIIGTRKVIKI